MLKYILFLFFCLIPRSLFAVTPDTQVASGDNISILSKFLTGDFIVSMMINIALVIVVVIITFIISKFVQGKLFRYLEAANIGDESSKEEIIGVISRTMNIVVLITGFSISLGILGVDLGIFMGGIGFGIGFTLRTFLTNFISGIIVVSQGSYHIGDLIEVGSNTGRITKINALFTEVEEFDGTMFNIPNIRFFEENVRNFYTNDKRRIDVQVVVDYNTDILQAKKILFKVASNFPSILQAPAADVLVEDLGERGISLSLRVWISSKDNFITLKSNMIETINLAFKQTGIEIPYPKITLTDKK